jgi:hypothetical protein
MAVDTVGPVVVLAGGFDEVVLGDQMAGRVRGSDARGIGRDRTRRIPGDATGDVIQRVAYSCG